MIAEIISFLCGKYLPDPSILSISADLRKMALLIILLKAGLSLNMDDLKKVGRPAVMMVFVPSSFEIIGYLLFFLAWRRAAVQTSKHLPTSRFQSFWESFLVQSNRRLPAVFIF